MTMMDLLKQLEVESVTGQVAVGILIILSLIQISPLKLNPWDHILGWFGKKMNRDTDKNLSELGKRVDDIWINSHRQSILTFARECRAGIAHDSEEWANVLNQCEEYEHFTEVNDVTNGVVKENTRYIRDLYQKKSHERKI